MSINVTPAKNAAVPLYFAGLEKKNERVEGRPIVRVRPMRNNMLPKARRARSKNRRRPAKRDKKPPVQKATPSSGRERVISMGLCVLLV